MTFAEVSKNINDVYEARSLAFAEWKRTTAEADRRNHPFNGPTFDFAQIDRDLRQAAKDEFGFSDRQIDVIYGVAYERYHASYGDMPWGMHGLCEFAKKIMDLK